MFRFYGFACSFNILRFRAFGLGFKGLGVYGFMF